MAQTTRRFVAPTKSLVRYASIVHALVVRLEYDGHMDIVASFDFDDLFDMVIRPNRAIANKGSYTQKAARAKAIWPGVVVAVVGMRLTALVMIRVSFAQPSRAVTPPKRRSGLRRGRKGVDGEDLGRATIGLAMIGCDHA